MPNKKPEDKVKDKCLLYLRNWQERNIVIDFIDISDHGRKFNPYTGTWVMNTQKGRPDIIAWLNVRNWCWTYFIECKSERGVQSDKQKEFQYKFKGINGSFYEITSNPKQINSTIDILSGYGDKQLEKLPENVG